MRARTLLVATLAGSLLGCGSTPATPPDQPADTGPATATAPAGPVEQPSTPAPTDPAPPVEQPPTPEPTDPAPPVEQPPTPEPTDPAPPVEQPPTPEPPDETPEEPPDEPPADDTPGRLQDPDDPTHAKVVALVEQVTGRQFTRPVPVYVYTEDELKAEVASWGDFAPDNILGFYKHDTKALYLVPDKAGSNRLFGLHVHEATHALQDQLYDLTALQAPATTTDAQQALLGLIEGEAVMVMVDGLIDEQPAVAHIAQVRGPRNPNDPDAWRRVYTYAFGTRFIAHLKAQGGYGAVDAAFHAPPRSAEQIIHPEKYDQSVDWPDRIAVTADTVAGALPAGFKVIRVDSRGEFETRLRFVAHEATAADSESIAAGWGGDVEILARNGDRTLSLWVTTWDTPEDALEFAAAIQLLPGCHYSNWDGARWVIVLHGNLGLSAAEAAPLHAALAAAPITHDPEGH